MVIFGGRRGEGIYLVWWVLWWNCGIGGENEEGGSRDNFKGGKFVD